MGKNQKWRSKNQKVYSIYTEIYTLFAKGAYEQAVELKKETDRMAGENHWTPQLLYIEAAYYVQQKKDSTAIRILRELQLRFPNSPLYLRAADLLEAISKRASATAAANSTTTPTPSNFTNNNPSASTDSTTQPPPFTSFSWDDKTTHLVLFILEEIEPLLAAEAMRSIDNYNRSVYNTRTIQKELVTLDNRYRFIALGNFENYQEASVYLERAKARSASEIAPWLPAGKYKWLPISTTNLNELRLRKDLEAYQRFLNSKRP